MVSLTTVYLVSVILTSIAGFGSVFASKKFVGGSEIVEEVVNEPEPQEQIPQSIPNPAQEQVQILSDRIKSDFGMDQEFADGIIDFIKTPVTEWNSIASDQSELRKKFMKTLTHPNLNRCPQSLLRVCELVSKKYSNMKDFIDGKEYQNSGDQTLEAISLLQPSTEQTVPEVPSEPEVETR